MLLEEGSPLKHFKQHYIWHNSSQNLKRLLFLGRGWETPRVEITVSKLMMCVKLSKIRTENKFYRWC